MTAPEPEVMAAGAPERGTRPGTAGAPHEPAPPGSVGLSGTDRGFSSGPLGKGTLGRRLVLRVTALVALVAVLLASATALAARELLMDQVDSQLTAVIDRLRRPQGGDGPRGGLLQPGQPIGTLYSAFSSGGDVVGNAMLAERGQRPALPSSAVDQLAQVPVGKFPSSTTLPELGRYRVVTYSVVNGDEVVGRVVVGVPLEQLDLTLLRLVALEALLCLVAIAFTVVAARTLVERSLRPLNRVAATAQQVSRLELDRGEVALAVRVPPEDANPTSEVGRVGLAINHMLNNVAGALAARQASETKVRQFVADASHELRNPLAAIRGYAELTRRSGEELPRDAAYAIARVESEAERMSRLVEDLLLLARLDSGPDLDISPTDLTELVINAVSDARAAGPGHRWSLALPEEPVVAMGDKNRLHQVLTNLLANARTHTPAGTRVELGVQARNGQAVITVTDDGPGIPPDIRDSVFERFTRADTSRVRSAGAEQGASTGLGLAIVAAVVEAHSGQVGVRSQPGLTQFTVIIPLAPPGPSTRHPTPPVG